MSLAKSSTFVALGLFLFVLKDVTAQRTTAQCQPGWEWSSNSRGQSPCLMAAYLLGTCVAGGDFTVNPLPPNTHYPGPLKSDDDACECSTVTYSLMSACGLCQGRTALPWSGWSANCSTTYSKVFQPEIPAGVGIPDYAYADIIASNNFDPVAAKADASAPESSGSGKPTGSAGNSASATATAGGSPSASASSSGSKTNIGAIVGGVVGGVVVLALIGAAIAFFLIRRRRSNTAPSATYNNPQGDPHDDALLHSPSPQLPPPMSQSSYGDGPYSAYNQAPGSAKLYNPDDPATYPSGYTGPPQSLHTTQAHQPGRYSGIPEV